MCERNVMCAVNLPTAAALKRLQQRLSLPADAQDLYLAYDGAPQVGLSGILVAGKDDIDRVIAYCPLAKGGEPGTPEWRAEVLRQLRIASRVAERPETARNAPDVIWLGYAGSGARAVPSWVYSLACIPLTYDWGGELLSPRPFCPALFERMAGKPQAVQWLRNQYPSPTVTAGGPERTPAAPILNA